MKVINRKGAGSHIVLGVIIAVLVILLIVGWTATSFVIHSYNGLTKADIGVENQFGKVQSAYERRADLLPNLAETVRGSAEFEKETQTQVAMWRGGIKSARTPQELDQVGAQMSTFLAGNILGYVENYPELKSTEAFRVMMDELAGTENRIKFERDTYNDDVAAYKLTVRGFPQNLVANFFGFKEDKWQVFEATQEAQAAPKISFR